MELRAPAYPLITIDPYFSVWSFSDTLNGSDTVHWTGRSNRFTGSLQIGQKTLCFLGNMENAEKMRQCSVELTTFSTKYLMEYDGILLGIEFFSPLLITELEIAARPVSYLRVSLLSNPKAIPIMLSIQVDDEICLNEKGEFDVDYQEVQVDGLQCGRIGSKVQNILCRAGDDLRINWGYFYLATDGAGATLQPIRGKAFNHNDSCDLLLKIPLEQQVHGSTIITFAYDDIYSLEYFHCPLKAYWKRNGADICQILKRSFTEFETIHARCEAFDRLMTSVAEQIGSQHYAELLQLAFRQTVAAHKLCVDGSGNLLFVSKECFSNGCAATVDVSYPSVPIFLLYNPELVKGMLRPIFTYARTTEWIYPFAPHDVGTYPRLNGQTYGNLELHWQMPVEECGNMLLMTAAVCIAEHDASFAQEHWLLLQQWAQYLDAVGLDPDLQLCSDDFAGHLPHNCNLSVKAILGIAAYALLCGMLGKKNASALYMEKARRMGEKWLSYAANGDGTFRLALDQPGTFSLKYNLIWDSLLETHLFDSCQVKSELDSYLQRHAEPYGIPLDNRDSYTKSDWLMWVAAMYDDSDKFSDVVEMLWRTYNTTPSRVPMMDWYDAKTAVISGFLHHFRNRSVQGALFMKMLITMGLSNVVEEPARYV